MELIEVEIVNWEKHQPRKDIKHPTWFALSNRILEDAKLFGLTDAEWKALLYLFCQASQQNKSKAVLSLAHAQRICEISAITIRTMLDKLTYAGVTSTYAIRTDTSRDTTLQDTTIHNTTNITEQDTTRQVRTRQARSATTANSALNSEIWKAYSDAYFLRYGTEPVRNAAVNGKINQIGKRLGQEAPDVVRFFVSHNNAFYVRGGHKIGLCLADAEPLRTQWATDTRITNTHAQHLDQGGALDEQLKRLGGEK